MESPGLPMTAEHPSGNPCVVAAVAAEDLSLRHQDADGQAVGGVEEVAVDARHHPVAWLSSARAAEVTVVRVVRESPKVTMGVTSALGSYVTTFSVRRSSTQYSKTHW